MNSSSIPTHLREKRSRTTLKALIGIIFSENKKITLLHYIHSPVFHCKTKFITIQLSFTPKFIITLCLCRKCWKKKNLSFCKKSLSLWKWKWNAGQARRDRHIFPWHVFNWAAVDPENLKEVPLFLLLLMNCKYWIYKN